MNVVSVALRMGNDFANWVCQEGVENFALEAGLSIANAEGRIQNAVRGVKSVRIGAIITVELQEEASVEATNHVTFWLYLGRGRVNTRNRNLWQEDYGVGKLDNSNATHLLTS